jgi:hypothetical protein
VAQGLAEGCACVAAGVNSAFSVDAPGKGTGWDWANQEPATNIIKAIGNKPYRFTPKAHAPKYFVQPSIQLWRKWRKPERAFYLL